MNTAFFTAIDEHYRQTVGFTGLDLLADPVRSAMAAVDRQQFVPLERIAMAEADSALLIGCGQTISQPFIVALMTQLLALQPYHRVLEIGTGSGYQAAVLSHLAAHVDSVELIEDLALEAGARLDHLGYRNVTVHQKDGWLGLPERAPFDGILVTAAVETVPPALLEQLRPGGRLVIPLGQAGRVQKLTVVEREPEGNPRLRFVLPVSFVPFTRPH